MGFKEHHGTDRARSHRKSRWVRGGIAASLLIGMGAFAVQSGSWPDFSVDGGEYQVIAEWQIAAGGKGLMITISPDSTVEELRVLAKRLRDGFHGVDHAAVMIFDDAEAARLVRKGSANIDEARFQAALRHQRAMYLKSADRGEDGFTIYKAYPTVDQVIRFDGDNLQTRGR